MNKVKFFALGGLGEQGKNMYVVEVGERIFILDAGLKIPSVELYGIDAVIPDLTYIIDNKDRVQGIFLSHGHDDHIGAVPELLKIMNVGVFGTHFTISLLEVVLTEAGLNVEDYRLYRINDDKVLKFGNITVSFYATSHSIPESVGISINTSDGAIVYAPDFSFSSNSDKKYKTAFGKLSDIAKQGVLALFPESVGTSNFGRTNSDRTLIFMVNEVLHHSKRVIFSLYSTDLDRIQKIINISVANNRRVAIIGRKVQKIINIAMSTGYLKIPEDKLVNLKYIDDHNTNEDEDLVVIATGYRHEPFYTLQRMANKQDRLIQITDKDHVVLVTPPMPGTEKIAARTMDTLNQVEAKITSISKQDLRSSHAGPEDLKMLYGILNPKYIVPISGEYRHQYMHKNIAVDAGYNDPNVIVLENGEVITFVDGVLETTREKVSAGDVLIDGSLIGDINEVVLKDREQLSQAGTVLVIANIDARSKKILAGPEVVFKGFITGDLANEVKESIINITEKTILNHFSKKYIDWNELKNDLKEKINKDIYSQTKKNPIIIPVVMDIESKNN